MCPVGCIEAEHIAMSLDKSLKSGSALSRHRNVLTRAERVHLLQETNRWADDSTALGMPKVGHRKPALGKKPKKKEQSDEDKKK